MIFLIVAVQLNSLSMAFSLILWFKLQFDVSNVPFRAPTSNTGILASTQKTSNSILNLSPANYVFRACSTLQFSEQVVRAERPEFLSCSQE